MLVINCDRDQIVMSISNPKQQSCQSYHTSFQIGFLCVSSAIENKDSKCSFLNNLVMESNPHFYRALSNSVYYIVRLVTKYQVAQVFNRCEECRGSHFIVRL